MDADARSALVAAGLVAVVMAIVMAIVIGGGRASSRRCEALAQRARLPRWVVAERSVCLGSEDGVRWVVLR